MKTVTGTTGAWLSSLSMDENPENLTSLSFAAHDMTECGWTKVGTAEITVELFDDKEILSNQLSMLDEAEKRVKADAQAKLTEIEGQRQRLLAIEYKG